MTNQEFIDWILEAYPDCSFVDRTTVTGPRGEAYAGTIVRKLNDGKTYVASVPDLAYDSDCYYGAKRAVCRQLRVQPPPGLPSDVFNN